MKNDKTVGTTPSQTQSESRKEVMYHGIPASSGIAIGIALIVGNAGRATLDVEPKPITESEVPAEITRFTTALDKTRKQIAELQARLKSTLTSGDASIFDAHMLIVDDRVLVQEVIEGIRKDLQAADVVFSRTIQRYISAIGAVDDQYLKERAADVAPLADLHAPLGVWGCPGNHEYYSDYPAWRPVLRRLGIRMLDNEHALLRHRGRPFLLLGVTDPASSRFGLPCPDLEGTLRQALSVLPDGNAHGDAPGLIPTLLLAHRPALFSAIRGRVTLQLSGHTHGGMLLGPDLLVAAFNDGYVRGAYGDARSRLVVSPGCGLWGGFPYRLGVPGEVSLWVLRRA